MNNENRTQSNQSSKPDLKKIAVVIIPLVFAIALTVAIALLIGGKNIDGTPEASDGLMETPAQSDIAVGGEPEDDPNLFSQGLEFRSNADGSATVAGLGSCADKVLKIPSKSPSGEPVTSIGDNAFSGVTAIDEVILPESIVTIGAYAFKSSSIKSVTIGSSVMSIGTGAFAKCTSLSEIKVSGANALFTSENGILYSRDMTELICYPSGKSDTSYTIPASVTEIRSMALSSVPALKKIYFDGNAAKWKAIYIGSGNDVLDLITVEVNSSDK